MADSAHVPKEAKRAARNEQVNIYIYACCAAAAAMQCEGTKTPPAPALKKPSETGRLLLIESGAPGGGGMSRCLSSPGAVERKERKGGKGLWYGSSSRALDVGLLGV